MDYNTLLKKYPAYQGWGQNEALADFNATGGAGKGGSTTGVAAPAASGGLPDWSGMLGSLSSARNTFNAGQAGQEQDYLTRYRNAIGGQENTQAMANRLGTELGLPELRKTAFGLGQTLEGIPGVQTAATRGFDVNANQLQRIIAAKQAQIAPLYQKAVGQQQFAEGQLGEQLGYAQADRDRELLPFSAEGDFLSARLAREATGFSEDMGNTLSLYLNRLARGEQLSDAETARMNQLADAEDEFERQKQLYTFQTNEDIRKSKATGTSGADILKYLQMAGGQTNGTNTENTEKTVAEPSSLVWDETGSTPTETNSGFNLSKWWPLINPFFLQQ